MRLLLRVFCLRVLTHFNSTLTIDDGFREALLYFWSVIRHKKSDFTRLRQWQNR